jgi:hypothetical protein
VAAVAAILIIPLKILAQIKKDHHGQNGETQHREAVGPFQFHYMTELVRGTLTLRCAPRILRKCPLFTMA